MSRYERIAGCRQDIADYEVLVRLPNDERIVVTVAAGDWGEAKATAAHLHQVDISETQLCGIISREPQRCLA